jgi:hypothetical protein
MKQKLFRADPYDAQVLDEKGNESTFGRVLAAIEALSMDEDAPAATSRWCGYGTSEMVVEHLKKGPPVVGTIFMAKNEDLQHVGGRAGIRLPKLEEDEGLGKHIAFLWDKERDTLWVQRDQNSVGITAFQDYMSNRTKCSITITPRLHADAFKRLNKLKFLKRIDIAFSPMTHGGPRGADGKSALLEFLGMPGRLDAATIEIRIKPSRGKFLGPRSHAFLKDAARTLREGSKDIQTAKIRGVTGYDEDNNADWQSVDLLRDRMHFETEIDSSRFRDPKTLMVAIKRVWDDYSAGVDDEDDE